MWRLMDIRITYEEMVTVDNHKQTATPSHNQFSKTKLRDFTQEPSRAVGQSTMLPTTSTSLTNE